MVGAPKLVQINRRGGAAVGDLSLQRLNRGIAGAEVELQLGHLRPVGARRARKAPQNRQAAAQGDSQTQSMERGIPAAPSSRRPSLAPTHLAERVNINRVETAQDPPDLVVVSSLRGRCTKQQRCHTQQPSGGHRATRAARCGAESFSAPRFLFPRPTSLSLSLSRVRYDIPSPPPPPSILQRCPTCLGPMSPLALHRSAQPQRNASSQKKGTPEWPQPCRAAAP